MVSFAVAGFINEKSVSVVRKNWIESSNELSRSCFFENILLLLQGSKILWHNDW